MSSPLPGDDMPAAVQLRSGGTQVQTWRNLPAMKTHADLIREGRARVEAERAAQSAVDHPENPAGA